MRGPDNPPPSYINTLRAELLSTTRTHPLEPGTMQVCSAAPASLPSHPGVYLTPYELAQVVGVYEHVVRALAGHQIPAERDETGEWEFPWDTCAAWLRQHPSLYGRM
jgi:hypothetical protein